MDRWPLGLLVAALATALALLAAETLVNLAGLAPEPGLFTVTEGEFRRIPGIYAPHQQVVERKGTPWEHRATINGLGYRGAELPRAPAPGEFRVFFAGDSFTWGHNVEDGETLPARLQERLASACAGPVHVVNAGISGSTILGQAEMVRRGLELRPDRVILMFHENDIGELIEPRLWERLEENRRAKSRLPLSLVYPWARHTALWRLALSATHALRVRVGEAGGPDAASSRSAHSRGAPREIQAAGLLPGWRGAGADPGSVAAGPPPQGAAPATPPRDRAGALAEYAHRGQGLVELLRERGIPLLYVLYPHPESVRRGEGGEDYRWAREWARDAGVPVLDLLPVLQASGLTVEEAFLVPEDYHPSPAGYVVAARAVEEALASAFPPACRGDGAPTTLAHTPG